MFADKCHPPSCDQPAPAVPGPGLLAAPGGHLSAPAGGGHRQWGVSQEIQEAEEKSGD